MSGLVLSTDYSARVATAADAVTAGYAVCEPSTLDGFAVATTANLALAGGRFSGIAITSGGPTSPIQVVVVGPVPAAYVGTLSGSGDYVDVNASGALLRSSSATSATIGMYHPTGAVIVDLGIQFGGAVTGNATAIQGVTVSSASASRSYELRGDGTNIRSVFAGKAYLRDYGAAFDGTTDDGPALQSAIDAAGINGTVYVDPPLGMSGDVQICLKTPVEIGRDKSTNATQVGVTIRTEVAPRSGVYSVGLRNKVHDFRGTAGTIASKTGSLVRFTIPQADWAAAMLEATGSATTYCNSWELYNLQIELDSCTTNASNDYYNIARVVNDNRDAGGTVSLDLYDAGGSCGATDANNGAIGWRIKRHMLGVYTRRCRLVDVHVTQEAGYYTGSIYEVNEHPDVDSIVTFTDFIGCTITLSSASSSSNYWRFDGWNIGRAITPYPGRSCYAAASGSYTARANLTAYSVGDVRVASGATSTPNAAYVCTTAGTSAAAQPATFTNQCLQYDWGTTVSDGSVTWTRIYPGGTVPSSRVAWAPLTAYSVNDTRFTQTTTGRKRQMKWRCIVAGTSGATEPTEFSYSGGRSKDAPVPGVRVTDGTAQWVCEYDAAPSCSSYRPNLDFCFFVRCLVQYCRASWLVDSTTGQSRQHQWIDTESQHHQVAIGTPDEMRLSYGGAYTGACQINWTGGGSSNAWDAFIHAKAASYSCHLQNAYCEGGGRIFFGGTGFGLEIRDCNLGGNVTRASGAGSFSHGYLIRTSCQRLDIQGGHLTMAGGDATLIAPIEIDGTNHTGNARPMDIGIRGVTADTSTRRGSPAQWKSTRREPFKLTVGDTLTGSSTSVSGSAQATAALLATVGVGDCATASRATADEVVAILNRDMASRTRWWRDWQGFIYGESLAVGNSGLQTAGGDSVSFTASNLATACGITTGFSYVQYPEKAISPDSNRLVWPKTETNGANSFSTWNARLSIDLPEVKEGGTYRAAFRCDREYIASGRTAGTDWGKRLVSVATPPSEQGAPIRNYGGTVTFSEGITSAPIVFPTAEDDTSYDILFDRAPSAVTGVPTAGGPIVLTSTKTVYGCRVDRVSSVWAATAAGAGTSETWGYTLQRRNATAAAWTPLACTSLTIYGWYQNENITAGAFSPWTNSATVSGKFGSLAEATNPPTGTVGGGPGGRNYLTFDGTNDILSTAELSTALAQTYVFFVVARLPGATDAMTMAGTTTGANKCYLQLVQTTTPDRVVSNAGSTVTNSNAAFTVTNWSQYANVYGGSSYAGPVYDWRTIYNGTIVGAGSVSTGTNDFKALILGSNGAGTFGNVDIAEVVVAKLVSGAKYEDWIADCYRVSNYLKAKFGL